MKTSTAIKIALALTIPAYIWQGFVFSKMWIWFVVPAFKVDPISIAISVGLIMLASMVTTRDTSGNGDDDNYEIIGRAIGKHFGYPAVILLMAFIASRFVG